jgi:hypothetical protein
MKKSMVAVVATIVLLIVALGGSAAHAQEPTVWIWAATDGKIHNVTTQDVIGFKDGWGASTPGLLKMFLKASHTSLVLKNADTGEVILSVTDDQIAEKYLGVAHGTPDELWGEGVACPMPYQWWDIWEYGYGRLPVGNYTLVETWTLDHPVNDATHPCTDNGGPFSSTPALYPAGTVIATVHIVVSAG